MTDPISSDAEIDPDAVPSRRSRGDFPVSTVSVPVRSGGWLWWVVGFALFFASLAWVWSMHNAITRLEQRLADSTGRQGMAPSSEQQQQILSFETRLARILGSSVESKLRALERSVERGPLTPEELRLLESTASELRLLQSSNPAAMGGLASEINDHPRYQTVASASPATSTRVDPLDDIAELRKMYYAALICFALLGVVTAGLWYHHRRRYRLIELPLRHQLPVIKSYHEDRGR